MEELNESKRMGCFERNSIRFFGGVYAAALVALVIAGMTAPDLFVKKSQEMITETPGLSSPESSYVFDMTDYKREHQSIYLSMRLNVPRQLRQAIIFGGTNKHETFMKFNITVYGSPHGRVASDPCPTGCVTCPEGHALLGLECDCLANEVARGDTITCESGDEWCSWLPLYNLDFVLFKTFYFAIETRNDLDYFTDAADPESSDDWVAQFRVVFVSQWYTGFEIVWFYLWCLVTLMVMFMPKWGFFTSPWMERIAWSEWSPQQKWVGVLLVALLFFNNPFFAAQLYSDHPREFYIWFAVAEGVVVGLLMLYWLDRLLDIGRSPHGDRSKEGLPKVAQKMLTAFICLTYVINMIQLRLMREGDPDRVHKYPESSSAGERALTIMCLVYCVWLVILGVRACNAVDLTAVRRSPRMMFFLVASAVTMIVLLPSVILSHLSPSVRGGVAFSMAHGSINLYILAMALLCTPTPVREGTPNGKTGVGDVEHHSQDAGIEIEESSVNPPLRSKSLKWWQSNQARPKIADSSIWEDVEYTPRS